jgi:hypothetical protein
MSQRTRGGGAFAASAATIYCIPASTINRSRLNRRVAELRGHGTIHHIRLNVETSYANKLDIWTSVTKEEKLTNMHT